jgi:UDP-N-acetyl-D-mannosaminuronic acid dehydrogenase
MSDESSTPGGPYGHAAAGGDLRDRFTSGEYPVAVYGLGKMGLPLACVYAQVTGSVIGVDVDPEVVTAVTAGNNPVKREPGLDDLLTDVVADDRLRATTDPIKAAESASIHVILIPTPITEDHEPDLSILDAVVDDIAAGLAPGDLVSVECTVPPRTSADRVVPALEAGSGLNRGGFGVAMCPERVSSGRALRDIRGSYPKVVGGYDDAATEAARQIYDEIVDNDVIAVSDATTAEAVKVFEGVYRDVNIALANELATLTDELGVDVNEAIDAANTLPYSDIHTPGPGVGGHCIPFYPYFLIDPFDTESPLLETGRSVNDSMPGFTVDKIREEFAAEGTQLSEASVLLFGVTYRPGVEETRASPALDIADILTNEGVTVYGVDPMLDDFDDFPLTKLALADLYDHSFDAVVVVTPHEEFDEVRWNDLERADGDLFVVDGRQSLDTSNIEHRVYTIGTGYADR